MTQSNWKVTRHLQTWPASSLIGSLLHQPTSSGNAWSSSNSCWHPHAAKEGQTQEATQEGQDDTPSDVGALAATNKHSPCSPSKSTEAQTISEVQDSNTPTAAKKRDLQRPKVSMQPVQDDPPSDGGTPLATKKWRPCSQSKTANAFPAAK